MKKIKYDNLSNNSSSISPIISKNVVKNRRIIHKKKKYLQRNVSSFSKLLKYSFSNNRSDKSPSNNPPFISSGGFNTLHARNRTRTRPVSIYPTEILSSFFRLPKKRVKYSGGFTNYEPALPVIHSSTSRAV